MTESNEGVRPQEIVAGVAAIRVETVVAEPARRWPGSELILPALVVFFLALPIFSRLCTEGNKESDYPGHIDIALKILREGAVPPHPLFHFCLLFLMGGDNPRAAPGMIAFLLALALAARSYLSSFLFTSHNTLRLLPHIVLCLALALAMPLPTWWKFPAIYPGQVSPNIWHSPTAIFAMPLALLLFILGIRALAAPSLSSMTLLGGGMILSLLSKPNYVMAFVPCFAVALAPGLFRLVRARQLSMISALGQMTVAFVPVLAILIWQYLATFRTDDLSDGKVIVDPLFVWHSMSNNVPVSILVGIAFPLTVAICFPRQANQDMKVALAWAVLIGAIFFFAEFREVGPRAIHGNFGWGLPLADNVLFVVSANLLIRQPSSIRKDTAFFVLGLHAAVGLIYLLRCLETPANAVFY